MICIELYAVIVESCYYYGFMMYTLIFRWYVSIKSLGLAFWKFCVSFCDPSLLFIQSIPLLVTMSSKINVTLPQTTISCGILNN